MYQKSATRGLAPTQPMDKNTVTGPVRHNRTMRHDDVSVVTSMFGGKFNPVAMIPLLREDRAMNAKLTINFQMAETADLLLNPVRATASAWLVPRLAFERFQGFDSINRSYNGQPEVDNNVIPWFESWTPNASPLLEKLGIHHSGGQKANTDYVEAYNAVWNHIAKNTSQDIELRDRMDDTIAPAFWEHTQMKNVKATFDDAMMEGQVPIEFVGESGLLPVTGISRRGPADALGGANASIWANETQAFIGDGTSSVDVMFQIANDGVSSIFAEMNEQNFQLTLANIDLARETAAWARLRSQYQGLDEDWMMDQLLSGIAMPEQAMKQPILLDKKSVPFGMTQRYATDSGNLDQSATNGQTGVQLSIRTPAVNTGGVIVIAAQALPEMIYERQRDYYFTARTVDELPNRVQDELDPQPVVEVFNAEVDELHSLPGDVFGYSPLNHQWIRNKPKIGGKYYRADPLGPWDEDRNRIWDTTTVDPKLGEDFYLASNIRHDVFMSSNEEPFEVWAVGRVPIEGLTFFGPALRESSGDYEAVLDQVKTERIEPPAATTQAAQRSAKNLKPDESAPEK